MPWRNEDSELLQINAVKVGEEKFNLIHENSKPFYHDRDLDLSQLDEMVEEAIREFEEEQSLQNDMELDADEDESAEIYFEDEEGLEKKKRAEQFRPLNIVDREEYDKIMRSLNQKQRRLVLEILYRIKTGKQPFHIFLSGGAGVGKSHAITAIVQSLLRYHSEFPSLHPEEICVLVCAPTGNFLFT